MKRLRRLKIEEGEWIGMASGLRVNRELRM